MLPSTEADYVGGMALVAAFWGIFDLGLDMIVVVGVIDLQNGVGRQIQDVRGDLEFTFHPELKGLFCKPS
jgi:hypothetical protein